MLHSLDTRVLVFPEFAVPHNEVPPGGGHRALRLQADLSPGLPLGPVEEKMRQEKLTSIIQLP